MKRILSILVVMLVLTCSVLAAASGSTSPTPSTDNEEVDPLPDRAIAVDDISYLDNFPFVPIATGTPDKYYVAEYGLLVDEQRIVMSSDRLTFVFSTGRNKPVYLVSPYLCQLYLGNKYTGAVEMTIHQLSSYSSQFSLYYIAFSNFNTSGLQTYIPEYSSLSSGLSALSSAIDAAYDAPVDQSTVLDALHHTNNMLAGLFFCLGITTGSVVMRYFWGALK